MSDEYCFDSETQKDCWNAEKWAADFKNVTDLIRESGFVSAREKLYRMRIEVFRHTMRQVERFATSGPECAINRESVGRMQRGARLYKNEFFVFKYEANAEPTRVEVREQDCLLAARELGEEGFNVAVLNLANRQNPGGGVLQGMGAQEENLFRRTNLFRAMYQFAPYATDYGLEKSPDQYPIDRNFGGVYVPDAAVFRGPESAGYPILERPFFTSFIAVPAMNRPPLTPDNSQIAKELVEPTKHKMRTIFRVGISNGHDALVLGAFGCGVYRNPPGHIARLFHEVMGEQEFANKLRRVVFAIVEDHNSRLAHNPGGNLIPFRCEFSDT